MHDKTNEQMAERSLSASLVAPEGLGFGEGSIGVLDRVSNEDDPLTQEVLDTVDAAIDSDDILVSVDVDKSTGAMLDDDGCGDGRGVKSVFEGIKQRVKSLNRAKVFGGAPVMMTAALIGLGKARGNLNAVFRGAVETLKEKGIGFGGHSDTHRHGPNCGCGAIDKAPAIAQAVIEKKTEITSAIDTLGIETSGLGSIFNEYEAYVKDNVVGHEDEYSGVKAHGELADSGKVSKELDGDHAEVRIILNMVYGKTVNQELIRQVSGEAAQVFAVDVWRLQSIAERTFDNPEEQHRAFLSMLVHTLAVSAVLTKGDLPVYVVDSANQSVSRDAELVTV